MKKKDHENIIKMLRRTVEDANRRLDCRLDNNFDELITIQEQLRQIIETNEQVIRMLSF